MKLSVEELEEQISEAKKGRAKVDKEYVGNTELEHIFEYKYNYTKFLDNIVKCIKGGKSRDGYRSEKEIIIQ